MDLPFSIDLSGRTLSSREQAVSWAVSFLVPWRRAVPRGGC